MSWGWWRNALGKKRTKPAVMAFRVRAQVNVGSCWIRGLAIRVSRIITAIPATAVHYTKWRNDEQCERDAVSPCTYTIITIWYIMIGLSWFIGGSHDSRAQLPDIREFLRFHASNKTAVVEFYHAAKAREVWSFWSPTPLGTCGMITWYNL